MKKNIEIKANSKNFTRQMELAANLSGAGSTVISQEDIFFNVPLGRLKLRVFTEADGVLIFYNRPDQKGPKTSEYFLSQTSNPRSLAKLLESALGVRNSVLKTRTLHMIGRTRVHFDEVHSLGSFIELEVVLEEGDDEIAGQMEANSLMEQLEIMPEDLIECAYVDLLEAMPAKK